MEWFSRLTGSSCSAKAKGRRSLVFLVCWAIWQEQNSRIFEAQEKSLLWLLAAIKDEAMLWVTTIKTVVQQNLCSDGKIDRNKFFSSIFT
jgi:hypothetical protein